MSTIPGWRTRRAELNRQTPYRSYDNMRLYRGTNKTIGMVKAERLCLKNARRAECGLPPKATYAEI